METGYLAKRIEREYGSLKASARNNASISCRSMLYKYFASATAPTVLMQRNGST